MRLRSIASIFAASLIAMAPVHALAQTPDEAVSVRDRARPEYDPLGKRFGGFDLHASLGLGVTSTDNLFATETSAEDDMIYTVAPDLRLSSHWSRHALSLAAGAESNSHQDFDSEDATTSYVAAQGRLDVGSDTQISAAAGWAHEVEPRTDPDALQLSEPVEYDRTDASITAQHSFNRVRVAATYAVADYDYDDAGLIDQDFRDHSEDAISGRVEVAVTPRVAIVAQATSDNRDYDNLAIMSSEGQTYLAGIAVDLTNLLHGELTAGQFTRDYDSGISVDGTAIAANLEWYITQLTTITVEAKRAAEENGATVAAPYIEEQYGARVDHELLRNVILSADLSRGKREYQGIDREDEYFAGGAEVQYLMNRHVVWRGRYTHEETESTGIARYRDYDVNRFTLGVSLRL